MPQQKGRRARRNIFGNTDLPNTRRNGDLRMAVTASINRGESNNVGGFVKGGEDQSAILVAFPPVVRAP